MPVNDLSKYIFVCIIRTILKNYWEKMYNSSAFETVLVLVQTFEVIKPTSYYRKLAQSTQAAKYLETVLNKTAQAIQHQQPATTACAITVVTTYVSAGIPQLLK